MKKDYIITLTISVEEEQALIQLTGNSTIDTLVQTCGLSAGQAKLIQYMYDVLNYYEEEK